MNEKSASQSPRALLQAIDQKLDLFPRWLTALWDRALPVMQVLFWCRFSIGVVLIAAGFLLLAPQGQEIAIRIGDSLPQTIIVAVGAFVWAFHSWFGARRVLRRRYGPSRGIARGESFKRLVDHMPRWIGQAAFAIATGSAIMAWAQSGWRWDTWHWLMVALNGVLGLSFFQLMKSRKAWQQRLLGAGKDDIDDLEQIVIPLTWVYGLVLFLAACVAPIALGFWLGSLGILFLALSTIVSFGTWLVLDTTPKDDAHADQTQRFPFPVITALILWALLLSFWPYNNNHIVPVLQTPVDQRPGLDTFVRAWRDQAPTVGNAKPMVVVATAGGGIRAAYWTASVLGQISDAEPTFRRSLLAISGVSGGSVGAAVYAATVREVAPGCDGSAPAAPACAVTPRALEALSAEFLAPAIARMFYPDLVQRFLPVALLPDRGNVLADAWQANWKDAIRRPRTDGLDAPLASLWQDHPAADRPWLPALLLNSTHVQTGQRVIASNLDLDRSVARNGERAFLNAVDLLGLIQADVHLGTAALNSARFTYVSPAGTLPCAGNHWLSTCRNGEVVDGGYFENFGAVSAKQLLEAATVHAPDARPLVILISNDVHLKDSIEHDKPPKELPSQGFASETLTPVRALLATRESRGVLAAQELRAAVPRREDFFHFRVMLTEHQAEPALGWALNQGSEQLLKDMLSCRPENRAEFQRLLAALGVPDERLQAATACTNPKWR